MRSPVRPMHALTATHTPCSLSPREKEMAAQASSSFRLAAHQVFVPCSAAEGESTFVCATGVVFSKSLPTFYVYVVPQQANLASVLLLARYGKMMPRH